MKEGSPILNASAAENGEDQRRKEFLTLARELHESREVFPFPGLEPSAYENLKSSDAEYPGYSTPIDEIIERFKTEGMKVVLGANPESGNVFILPALSDDIENDMVLPKHFRTEGISNEKLRALIEKSK